MDIIEERRDLACPDQDALNLASQGNVMILDDRWNFQWHIDIKMKRSSTYKNQQLIHYSSDIKPWAHPEYHLSKYFWTAARLSPFYEEILFNNIGRAVNVEGAKRQNSDKSQVENIFVRWKRIFKQDCKEKGLLVAIVHSFKLLKNKIIKN